MVEHVTGAGLSTCLPVRSKGSTDFNGPREGTQGYRMLNDVEFIQNIGRFDLAKPIRALSERESHGI